jgi:hypothetical protein
MILTIPVLLYQLLFVFVLFVASRFGRKALAFAAIVCGLWTLTHVFFLPLMLLQGMVIAVSYFGFRRRFARKVLPTPRV